MKESFKKYGQVFQNYIPLMGTVVVILLLIEIIWRAGFLSPLVLSFLGVLIFLEFYFISIVRFMLDANRQYPFLRFVMHLCAFSFLTIFLFGALYAFFPNEAHHLIHTVTGATVTGFDNAVYFSGVTMLSIGYGDVVPLGFFRLMSIIEAFIGSFIILSFFSLGISQMFLAAKMRMEHGQILKAEKKILKKEDQILKKKKKK